MNGKTAPHSNDHNDAVVSQYQLPTQPYVNVALRLIRNSTYGIQAEQTLKYVDHRIRRELADGFVLYNKNIEVI